MMLHRLEFRGDAHESCGVSSLKLHVINCGVYLQGQPSSAIRQQEAQNNLHPNVCAEEVKGEETSIKVLSNAFWDSPQSQPTHRASTCCNRSYRNWSERQNLDSSEASFPTQRVHLKICFMKTQRCHQRRVRPSKSFSTSSTKI